jgi:pyruvate formate lyase activating enzyme
VGVKSVAVTAGYISDEARRDFFPFLDAANVDLKAFTEDFYQHVAMGSLAPVLETLEYLKHETNVWFELTTLLIPGYNDSDDEIDRMTTWVVEHLGPNVPMHFSAFHPDFKMTDVPPTPPSTLSHARKIALANGVRFAYTGNVHDNEGDTTFCPGCGAPVIRRDWYVLLDYQLTDDGRCKQCDAEIPGVFEGPAGDWGARRVPVRMSGRVPR